MHPAAPRAAHYALAHRVIPGLVFRNPMIAVALHLEAEGTTAHDRSFVDSFVRAANRTAHDDAPIEDGSVRLSSALIEGHAAAVFHFPPPQHTTEAFFSAVVQGFEFASPPRNRARVAPRYFVLEHSTDRPAPHSTRRLVPRRHPLQLRPRPCPHEASLPRCHRRPPPDSGQATQRRLTDVAATGSTPHRRQPPTQTDAVIPPHAAPPPPARRSVAPETP